MASKRKGMGIVLSALFAALIGVMCFFHIPLPGGIPVVLQDMMAFLAGAALGPFYGGIAVFIYIVLGCLGLPVFSGKAGLHIIVSGPTGGFIIGYFLSAIAIGLFLKFFLPQSNRDKIAKNYILIVLAYLVGTIILYTCGIAGFMIITAKSFVEAFAVCAIPFIPGCVVKLVLFAALTKTLRPLVYNYIWN
ncbi:MAG: biotin transporter BioY [Treponema sp.]|nr:biotin transporter BioY [Treponema sp.]MBD5410407.1 biotin transporter BioY [Treponema sp.]MBD5411443.1 biotin transporter BioY [Treponema sp.]MBD5413498.1 biotin transporter BioY [Treponema sp.]MDE6245448.1 biotin transporter BioY [Treponemataceae bacterium]